MSHLRAADGDASPVVAVVDDDPLMLESVQDLLECAGYTVRTFPSGEALLQSDALRTIACLISDIIMPGIDGVELRRRVCAARPGLAVLLMTARRELAGAQGAALAHTRVFTKPFDSAELLGAVAQAVRGSG